MAININQQKGMFLAGGILAYMFAGKLGPVKTISKWGGLAAAALGASDVLGIFPISNVTKYIPSFYAGSYATNNVLPYIDYPERY